MLTELQDALLGVSRYITLRRARSYRLGAVWAAVCPQHLRGVHRYTLAGGVACWSYWKSLEEAAAELGIPVEDDE